MRLRDHWARRRDGTCGVSAPIAWGACHQLHERHRIFTDINFGIPNTTGPLWSLCWWWTVAIATCHSTTTSSGEWHWKLELSVCRPMTCTHTASCPQTALTLAHRCFTELFSSKQGWELATTHVTGVKLVCGSLALLFNPITVPILYKSHLNDMVPQSESTNISLLCGALFGEARPIS